MNIGYGRTGTFDTLLTTWTTGGSTSAGVRVAAVLFITALTAAGAQISMPLGFTPVPLVMQDMVVLLGGAALGSRLGMAAQVNTYNGMIDGTVTRIDPAVVDGSVQVDVTPSGALPAGARPDLSVDGRIRIAELKQVLSMGRPAQVEPNSEASLFRLDASGNTASRIKVRVGATSVDRVQIMQGLQPGDRVILSDTSQWDKYEQLRLR